MWPPTPLCADASTPIPALPVQDTSLGAEASILTFGLGPMYTLWLDTARDEQNADGSLGFYAPTPITDQRDGSPNWMTGFPTGASHLLGLIKAPL